MPTPALGTAERPLRVAIVGSGPSGFYAAEALLQAAIVAEVDMLERLPVPYGLVRFGVAPDHAKLKSVCTVFAEIAGHERFRFFGNVSLGTDIGVEDLAQQYHAVIVATGAGADRRLGIPGEDLAGVHAASAFVGWYNGHPEFSAQRFDLSQEVALVVGQGNVAIDVCRILAKPVDELRHTDIAQHALEGLAGSRVREIHLIGRRGPAQARFTPKELRELGAIPGWCPQVDSEDLQLGAVCEAELAQPAQLAQRKNIEILRGFAARRPAAGERPIRLRFLRAPVALQGEGALQSATLETQRLAGEMNRQSAQGTGRSTRQPAGLLFRSVGYRGVPVAGLPFDAGLGVLPNRDGRVIDADRQWLRGWYAAGWIKRGPSGVIGTNRLDGVETVARLLDDLPQLDAARSGRSGLQSLLDRRQRQALDFGDWLAIEALERARGAARGKSAEKFVHVAEMLAAAATRPRGAAP